MMKLKTWLSGMLAVAGTMGVWGTAGAADILCKDPLLNHMEVPDTQVSACIDAGLGNIGNGQNDDFLDPTNPEGAGFTNVGDGTFNAATGTWSFNAALWDTNDVLSIGFKFGTGNTPDEWFIYRLVTDVSSGTYEFFCELCGGNGEGGLSHVVVYGSSSFIGGTGSSGSSGVPEPGSSSLALLGLGLLGASFWARKKKA